ncbi:DUF6221 family protein [Streptomyces lavendulocolor]
MRRVDLVEFLTARYDEEAAIVRDGVDAGESNISVLDLVDVETKRSVLSAYAAVADMDTANPEPEFAHGRAVGLGGPVRLLALPYAGHSAYDEVWRP